MFQAVAPPLVLFQTALSCKRLATVLTGERPVSDFGVIAHVSCQIAVYAKPSVTCLEQTDKRLEPCVHAPVSVTGARSFECFFTPLVAADTNSGIVIPAPMCIKLTLVPKMLATTFVETSNGFASSVATHVSFQVVEEQEPTVTALVWTDTRLVPRMTAQMLLTIGIISESLYTALMRAAKNAHPGVRDHRGAQPVPFPESFSTAILRAGQGFVRQVKTLVDGPVTTASEPFWTVHMGTNKRPDISVQAQVNSQGFPAHQPFPAFCARAHEKGHSGTTRRSPGGSCTTTGSRLCLRRAALPASKHFQQRRRGAQGRRIGHDA